LRRAWSWPGALVQAARRERPSRSAYLTAVTTATNAAKKAGFLLPTDADAIIAAAGKAQLPV
jgi:hypothetical protein